MYRKIDKKPFWLIAPTGDEIKKVDKLSARIARAGNTSFLMKLMLALWIMGVLGLLFSNTSLVLSIVFFAGMILVGVTFVSVLLGEVIAQVQLKRLVANGRAVPLRSYEATPGWQVGSTLLHDVLFDGARWVPSDDQLEVIEDIEPSPLDWFLQNPENREILERLSATATASAREELRQLLLPRLSEVIDQVSIEVEQQKKFNERRAATFKPEAKAAEADELVRTREFIRSLKSDRKAAD